MDLYDSSDDEVDDIEDDDDNGALIDENPSDDVVDHNKASKPLQYRLSGSKGEAPATIGGRNAALVHFNDFLRTKLLPPFDELSKEQICNKSLWQEYGTYLSEFAKKKTKVRPTLYIVCCKHNFTYIVNDFLSQEDDFLSDGTALNAFSGPKEMARVKFGEDRCWLDQNIWCGRIRLDIKNVVLKRCIELGIQTSKKSKPIGRDALLDLNRAMLQLPSPAEQRTAITFRLAFNMTFQAVGRGGECAYSSYNKSHWDTVYNAWCMTWYCQKTNAVKNMSLFCDAQRYELDIFHSLCCYWILGADSSHVQHTDVGRDWIFPALKSADNKGVATKLSKHLKKMAALTASVPRDVTAKSLRVGAVGEILTRTGDVVVGTVRGGWGGQLSGVATILEYHMESDYTLSIGGKALAGWADPKKPVFPPSCDTITASMTTDQVAHFHSFLRFLFSAVHFNIMDSPLHPLALCMWASFVQYLPQFIEHCGRGHVVMTTVETATRKFGYTLSMLRQWGEAVHSDWQLRNVLNAEQSSDLGPVVVKLQQEVINLQKQVQLMERASATQYQQSTQQWNRIEKLLSHLAVPPTDVASGSKRSRTGTIGADDAMETAAGVNNSSASVPTLAIEEVAPASSLMLVPPSPLFQFTTSHTLYDFYSVWYERGFDLVNVPARWECDDRRWKDKLIQAVEYTAKVLSKHEELKSRLQQAPNVTSAEYSTWKQAFNTSCASLVAAVVESAEKDFSKKFREIPTVSSLYNKFKPRRTNVSASAAGTKIPASVKKAVVNKGVVTKVGANKAVATKPAFK